MWEPQPKQRLALMSKDFELFFGGARGGGKSDFLLADFARGIEHGDAYTGIIFRHTYPQLEELISRSYDLYKPLGGTYNQKDNIWKFPTGAKLKMRPLENDRDVRSYQGHQYQFVAFDEVTNWATDYAYLTLFGCVRSAKGVPCFVRAAANPRGPGHQWVKRRFIDPAPPMTPFRDPDTGLSRVFIPSFITDNLALMKNDPTYEIRLKALPPSLYKAYRFGDWDTIEGQFFEEFDRRVHVVQPFSIPKTWRKFCCMDWGYSRPYAILWVAVDHDGRGWIYREKYGCTGKPNEGTKEDALEVAKSAWNASLYEGVTEMVADPACWTKIGLGASIADQFHKAGFRMTKANNDRKNGWMRLHQVMKQVNENRPMIQIFSNCINLIRTLPTMPTDPANPDDLDTNAEDHLADALRYGSMSQFWREYQPARPVGRKTWNPLD